MCGHFAVATTLIEMGPTWNSEDLEGCDLCLSCWHGCYRVMRAGKRPSEVRALDEALISGW